jgi:hypothetical protein
MYISFDGKEISDEVAEYGKNPGNTRTKYEHTSIYATSICNKNKAATSSPSRVAEYDHRVDRSEQHRIHKSSGEQSLPDVTVKRSLQTKEA